MSAKKVSGKTHTQAQLDDWANQHNPNNKAYRARMDSWQSKKKPHSQRHNAQRRYRDKAAFIAWAPDYLDYDD